MDRHCALVDGLDDTPVFERATTAKKKMEFAPRRPLSLDSILEWQNLSYGRLLFVICTQHDINARVESEKLQSSQ